MSVDAKLVCGLGTTAVLPVLTHTAGLPQRFSLFFQFYFFSPKFHPVAPHSSTFICPEQRCGVANPSVGRAGARAARGPLAARGQAARAPRTLRLTGADPKCAAARCPRRSEPSRPSPPQGPVPRLPAKLERRPEPCWPPGLHFLLKWLTSAVLEANDLQGPAAGPGRWGGGGTAPGRDSRAPRLFVRQPLPAPASLGASSRRGERRKGKAWETEPALCCSHKAPLFGGLSGAF